MPLMPSFAYMDAVPEEELAGAEALLGLVALLRVELDLGLDHAIWQDGDKSRKLYAVPNKQTKPPCNSVFAFRNKEKLSIGAL